MKLLYSLPNALSAPSSDSAESTACEGTIARILKRPFKPNIAASLNSVHIPLTLDHIPRIILPLLDQHHSCVYTAKEHVAANARPARPSLKSSTMGSDNGAPGASSGLHASGLTGGRGP